MSNQMTKKQAVAQAQQFYTDEFGVKPAKADIKDVEISPSEVKFRIGKKCFHFAYTIHNVTECGHFRFVEDISEVDGEVVE